jgi:uncharacterized Zn-binding protein involved in type VI secretion
MKYTVDYFVNHIISLVFMEFRLHKYLSRGDFMAQITRIGDPYSDGDFQAMGSGSVFVNNIPLARLGDLTTGHGCWPPAQIVAGSPTVFANGIPVGRVGDPHLIHCCPDDGCHDGIFVSGSPNVFADQSVSGAQPEITFEDAVMRLQDEEPEPVPLPPTDQRQVNKNAAYKQAFGPTFVFDNSPPPVLDTKPPKPVATVSSDCDNIHSHVGPFPGSFQLSPNFVLSQLTTNTVVSNYPLRAQLGLSEADIVCNLRKLCYNVLEVLLDIYGSIQINSGFRHIGNGATNSQHFKGQAADVTFRDLRTSDDFNARAEELKNTGIYDQMIFEQNRETAASTWFHMSYVDAKRGSVLTKKAQSDVYLHGLYKLTVV